MTTKTISVKVDSGDSKKTIDTLDSAMRNLGKGTKLTTDEISQLNKVAKGVKAGLADIQQPLSGASKGFAALRKNSGQASIQLQQFVGQVQGGQSALLALSQQGADLGIVLGAPLLGSVIGLSASLVSFLIPALFDAGEKADDFAEKAENAQKKLNEFIQTTDQASRNTATVVAVNKLNAEYDKLQETITNLEEKNKELSQAYKINAQAGQVAASVIAKNNEKIAQARKQQEILSKRIEETATVSQDASRQNQIETQKTITAEELKAQARARYDKRILDSFNTAISTERLKSERLRQEIEVRRALRDGEINQQQANEELGLINLFFAYEQRRNAILENERLTAEQKAEILAVYAEQEILAEEALQAGKTAATKKGTEERARLQLTENQKLAYYGQAAISIGALLNRKSEKQRKRWGVAQTIINTAVGIQKAVADYGYPAALPAIAAVAASGVAQIAAINGASGSGSISAGSTAAAPTPAAQPAQNTQQSVQVEFLGLSTLADSLENSNELYSGASMAKLVRSLNEAARNGLNTNTGG